MAGPHVDDKKSGSAYCARRGSGWRELQYTAHQIKENKENKKNKLLRII